MDLFFHTDSTGYSETTDRLGVFAARPAPAAAARLDLCRVAGVPERGIFPLLSECGTLSNRFRIRARLRRERAANDGCSRPRLAQACVLLLRNLALNVSGTELNEGYLQEAMRRL